MNNFNEYEQEILELSHQLINKFLKNNNWNKLDYEDFFSAVCEAICDANKYLLPDYEEKEEEDFNTKLDRCIDNLSGKEIEVLEQNFRIKEYQDTPKELNYSMESIIDKIQEWNINSISLIEMESEDFSFHDEFFAIQWTKDKKEPVVIYSWEGISQDFYDYCEAHQIFPTAFKN